MAKCGAPRNCWDLNGPMHRSSTLWKGILSVKDLFMENVRYIILAQCERVFFWLDSWIGDCPLALQFLDLFKCARHKDANVHNYLERGANRVIWGQSLEEI